MNTSAVELPSGQIIDLTDVIFVSNIKIKDSVLDSFFEFNVTWASRVCETLKYKDRESCERDRDFIKSKIIPQDLSEPMMICS